MTIAEIPPDLLNLAQPAEDRANRLEAGAARLAGRRASSILLHERFLVAVAGTLMTSGVIVILLGWYGASRAILVVKQVPYLISGGLLGVALATIGAMTFFTHWLSVLVRENRVNHQELLQAIRDERARDREVLLEVLRERRPIRASNRNS